MGTGAPLRVAGLPCTLIRVHCVSKLEGPCCGVSYCHAHHQVEPLLLFGRHCAEDRDQHVLAYKYDVHDVTLATAHPRTIGELTEDERNTLLAEIRAQPTVVRSLAQLNRSRVRTLTGMCTRTSGMVSTSHQRRPCPALLSHPMWSHQLWPSTLLLRQWLRCSLQRIQGSSRRCHQLVGDGGVATFVRQRSRFEQHREPTD